MLVRRVGVPRPAVWADGDLPSAQPFADIIVGLTLQLELHPATEKGAEALTGRAGEPEPHRSRRQPRIAVSLYDRSGHARPHREVVVLDVIVAGEGQGTVEIRLQVTQDLLIQRDQPRPRISLHGPPQGGIRMSSPPLPSCPAAQ